MGPELQNTAASKAQSQSTSTGLISREQLNQFLEAAGMAIAHLQCPYVGQAMRLARTGRNVQNAASNIGGGLEGSIERLSTNTNTTSATSGIETELESTVVRSGKLSVV